GHPRRRVERRPRHGRRTLSGVGARRVAGPLRRATRSAARVERPRHPDSRRRRDRLRRRDRRRNDVEHDCRRGARSGPSAFGARIARRAACGWRPDPSARHGHQRQRRRDRDRLSGGVPLTFRAMAPSPFTIGIIQDSASDDAAATVAATEARVREAAARGAQIICLKELFNAPYFCKAQQCERFDIAEPIPGPTTERMQRLARELGVVLIVPLFERQASGVYRNSAAIVDADGSLLGVYRKMHIPDDPLFYEKYYFTPGDSHVQHDGDHKGAGGFRVWKTRYADIGVLICWDQWYPEAARINALLGAEILFYPTAIGWHPAEKAEFG